MIFIPFNNPIIIIFAPILQTRPKYFQKKYFEEQIFYLNLRSHKLKRGTMAKKGNRIQVIMECTEHKESGMPGTSRYITTKNRKNTPDRMELKKYNPILKKMTVHKEIK